VRDLAGYRVYRATTPDFTPGPLNLVADETLLTRLPAPAFLDDHVVNCRDYYYRVTAVDLCGVESQASAVAEGRSTTSVRPMAPSSVEAFLGSPTRIKRVQWVEVREDAEGNEASIDKYKVFRAGPRSIDLPPPQPWDFCFHAVVEGGTSYEESVTLTTCEEVWYEVSAVDDCINESTYSAMVKPTCVFDGRVEIQEPAYGAKVWGPTTIRIVVEEGIETYAEIRVRGFNESTLESWEFTFADPGAVWTGTWDAQPDAGYPEGSYRIEAEVDQQYGSDVCTASTWTRVTVAPPGE